MRIDDFISGLMHKGRRNPAAGNTKKAYRSSVGKFERFLNGREPTIELAQESVDQEIANGLKLSSVARYGMAIRRYMFWAGHTDASEIILPEVPKGRVPKYLERQQIDALIKASRTPLDKAVVMVLVETGLRIGELLVLTKADIDHEGGFIFAHREKTGKEGWITISPAALEALDEYIAWANPKDGIFPQGYNKVYGWLKELGHLVGIEVHPHLFRHSAAALRRIQGQTRSQLKDLLGHVKEDTTSMYDGIKPPEQKKEIIVIFGEVKTCPRCKIEVDRRANYCPGCGGKLKPGAK